MRQLNPINILREFWHKGDPILLGLCLLASGYGMVLVFTATRWMGTNRLLIVQGAAVLLGVVAYVMITFVDLHLFVDRCWKMILCFDVGFILLVLTPIGVTAGGNRNWIQIAKLLPGALQERIGSFIPQMQPDEIVKLPFILLLAWQISRILEKEQDISSFPSILQLGGHTLFMAGFIFAVCSDLGMSVIYISIFAVMTWAAGVKLRWFAVVGGAAAAVAVILWVFILPRTKYWTDYRIMRFRVVFDHDLDPLGRGFQQSRSLLAIGSGQLFGQGFLHGAQTQANYSDALPERQTDFIFSVCGEEFGMVGCLLLLFLLSLIILRCIWNARHADSSFSACVAMGAAGMLIAQIFFNVGMCLFVAPVMGLTLPFISYGGSSVITMYAAMGMVSSVKAKALPSWLQDRAA